MQARRNHADRPASGLAFLAGSRSILVRPYRLQERNHEEHRHFRP